MNDIQDAVEEKSEDKLKEAKDLLEKDRLDRTTKCLAEIKAILEKYSCELTSSVQVNSR